MEGFRPSTSTSLVLRTQLYDVTSYGVTKWNTSLTCKCKNKCIYIHWQADRQTDRDEQTFIPDVGHPEIFHSFLQIVYQNETRVVFPHSSQKYTFRIIVSVQFGKRVYVNTDGTRQAMYV